MATKNTQEATVKASYIVNSSNGEVKVAVSNQKQTSAKKSLKTASGFAKNIRYSIYNNGGGYTGL